MTHDTDTTLSDTLAPLAKRLANVLAAKSDLEQEEKDIKAAIRAAVPGPDTYAAGDVTLSVSLNRRFSPARAEAVLPPQLLDLCRETVVTSAAAKAALPPVVYMSCMEEVGDYRVGFAR